ncbi:atrial natriuretic peptide receptor 1-like [Lineus longissimus]|uniref:atrial natriuretic peptide receptor 1-like n=1 Tax=Lineus longissimus TaxID=88925 RepID=UPI002B4F5720
MLTRDVSDVAGYVIVISTVFLSLIKSNHGEELRLGILTRKGGVFGWDQNMGAFLIAIDKLHKNGLMTNYTFRPIFNDDKNTPKRAAGLAVEMKVNHSVNVYIGPPNSQNTVPVGYLSSYWNVPHFSWASTNPILTDKKKYKTLVRSGLGTFSKFAKSLLLVCQKYKWKKIAVFLNKASICSYAREGIDQLFPKSGVDIAEQIIFESSQFSDAMVEDHLNRLRQRARIIVICGRRSSKIDEGRRILIAAQKLGMTNGEYVYFYPGTHSLNLKPKHWEITNDPDNDVAKEAYQSLFYITWRESEEEKDFRKNYARILSEPPYNNNSLLNVTVSQYVSFAHDTFYCYGVVYQKILDIGGNITNGTLFLEMAKNTTFEGVTGRVAFDDNGDREPDYTYWKFDKDTGEKYPAIEVLLTQGLQVVEVGTIDWVNSRRKPPPDTPSCGFFNEKCKEDNTGVIVGVVVALFVVATAAGGLAYWIRRKKQEEALAKMLWKVNYNEITLVTQKRGLESQVSFLSSTKSRNSSRGSQSGRPISPAPLEQNFTTLGRYKGQTIAVTRIRKDTLQLTKEDLVQLKAMRDLGHENMNPFIGACVDPPNFAVLFAYCAKGSLVDIIENDDIKLDLLFKRSLIQDLSNGLHYLHSSFLKSHGNLKSSNCVMDSRWMLKITDYGLQRLKVGQREDELGDHERYSRLWWTAPELLRQALPPPGGTQKGDVYGFGIIVYEITFRRAPYSTETLTPREIIDRIRAGEKNCFRPDIDDVPEDANANLVQMIEACWAENPNDRLDTTGIRKALNVINKGRKLNIMDNMLSMMEKYANNLEELVEQRTGELIEEKKKTDLLLYRMLPRQVAEKLKKGDLVKPEAFERVTIFFSDIVGFTTISAKSTPMQVIDLLNDLYTMFDSIIEKHDVYKVETIGDAYMVVSGAPVRNGDLHAGKIADMALSILHGIHHFQMPHMPHVQLQVRIGLHSGSCCAGVVGLSMPRYCLFGDTVNTASRMESTGKGMRIHLSTEANVALAHLGGYHTEMRGEIELKGKGKVITYWLNGRDGFTKQLPTEEEINNNPLRPDGLPQRYFWPDKSNANLSEA